jgi:hypothetical protein
VPGKAPREPGKPARSRTRIGGAAGDTARSTGESRGTSGETGEAGKFTRSSEARRARKESKAREDTRRSSESWASRETRVAGEPSRRSIEAGERTIRTCKGGEATGGGGVSEDLTNRSSKAGDSRTVLGSGRRTSFLGRDIERLANPTAHPAGVFQLTAGGLGGASQRDTLGRMARRFRGAGGLGGLVSRSDRGPRARVGAEGEPERCSGVARCSAKEIRPRHYWERMSAIDS